MQGAKKNKRETLRGLGTIKGRVRYQPCGLYINNSWKDWSCGVYVIGCLKRWLNVRYSNVGWTHTYRHTLRHTHTATHTVYRMATGHFPDRKEPNSAGCECGSECLCVWLLVWACVWVVFYVSLSVSVCGWLFGWLFGCGCVAHTMVFVLLGVSNTR